MKHNYRFIYNNDGWEPFIRYNAPIELKHILESVNELRRTQVDTLCWCVAEEVATYPSKKIEMVPNIPDSIMAVWYDLLAKGIDPFEHVVRQSRQAGLAIFASVRMNDCHHKSDPGGPLASKFWKEHQHFRLWDIDEAHCYYNAALDYSHAAVRQRKLDVIGEIAGMYDVDGIELDMGRNAHFFYQHEAERKKGILTDFLRKVRAALDRIARKKGRDRIGVMIRCPNEVEKLKQKGMDVATWMREKLADVFVMNVIEGNDFRTSVEPWQSLARKAGVLFRAGIECGPLHHAPADNHVIHHTPEEYHGIVQNYWQQGVGGIYLFNFSCLTTKFLQKPIAFKRHQDLLSIIGSPDTLRQRNKTYVFYDQLPIELELYRPPQWYQTVPFVVREPNIRRDGGHWEIEFKLTGFPEKNAVHYLVNGKRVPANGIRYAYGLKTHPYYAPKLIRSGFPVDAHQVITLRPPNEWIKNGDNTLAFYLERGPWGEYTGMKVYELEVRSVY